MEMVGMGEAGKSERCSSIVKYTAQKVLSILVLPFQKKRTQKSFFFCLAFDWNCILFRGVDLESTLCVSCAQTQKKANDSGKKQYTAAFLLIFIILLDLFLALLNEHGLKMKAR